ncbi:hypothetical protein Bca4012_072819 [Brassica carinata]|uniref:Uncharacterized protein n=1 Tax=Brassica carinata TaxID=52824 RepID=A0A8X7UC56_BRACI|nr:hypothetical protein Bca52824_065176 [Brassica carinata]
MELRGLDMEKRRNHDIAVRAIASHRRQDPSNNLTISTLLAQQASFLHLAWSLTNDVATLISHETMHEV